jgi:hypothetical protein
MPAFDFRPRSNTELLDASVEFVRKHFGVLAVTLALAQIPGLAMGLLFPPSPSDPFARWRNNPALALLQIIVAIWLQATMSVMFVYVVDDLLHGRAASLGRSLRRAVSRSISATVAVVIMYFVVALWAMLFFFPAIWAFARYFAVTTAFAIEDLPPLGAIRRSKSLAKGNNGRAIALARAPVVIVTVIAAIIQQGLLGAGVGMRGVQVVTVLFTIALYPFAAVPTIFLYYDLRTRREGLDLDLDPLPTAAA